jgi:hypothetical protein
MRKNIAEVNGKDGDEEKGKQIKEKTRHERVYFYVVVIPVDPSVQKITALQTLSTSG